MSDAIFSALKQLAQVLIEARVLTPVDINTVIDRLNDELNSRADEDQDDITDVIDAMPRAVADATEFDPN